MLEKLQEKVDDVIDGKYDERIYFEEHFLQKVVPVFFQLFLAIKEYSYI